MTEYVVLSNKKIPYRVKKNNLHLVPKGWTVMMNTVYAPYYNHKTKKISRKFRAVIELKNKEQVEKLIDRDTSEFDLLFGKLSKYTYDYA